MGNIVLLLGIATWNELLFQDRSRHFRNVTITAVHVQLVSNLAHNTIRLAPMISAVSICLAHAITVDNSNIVDVGVLLLTLPPSCLIGSLGLYIHHIY